MFNRKLNELRSDLKWRAKSPGSAENSPIELPSRPELPASLPGTARIIISTPSSS